MTKRLVEFEKHLIHTHVIIIYKDIPKLPKVTTKPNIPVILILKLGSSPNSLIMATFHLFL